MSKRRKVAVFGAGVGGLTVAHQLSKLPGFDITVYEKKDVVGGLARSGRDSEGCAIEYCWRVFFGFYDNLLGIMDEIPTQNGTTRSNLTEYHHKNLSDREATWKDKFIVWSSALYGFTSCDERMESLDNLTWWKALNSASSSNLYREIGGWLGMDRYKGSYRSVVKVGMEMQILPSYLDPTYKDYVTTKPTSEALFDWWVADLKNKGVKFAMNTEIDTLTNGCNVSSATVKSKHSVEQVEADYYVLCIPVEVLNQVLIRSKILNSNIKQLYENCLHIQLSFQLYFSKPISLGGNVNAFLHVDSPWDLIVLVYDKIYKDVPLCKLNPDVKGGWSVAATTAYIPGIVYNKPMLECSYEEIIDELWAQLASSKKLAKLVKENNEFELSPELIVKWARIWPSYSDSASPRYGSKLLNTTEPKFTNNAGSYKLRPSFKTPLDNLFIATGFIKETIDIFSMEAACIAGKRVANSISLGESQSPSIRQRPKLFAPIRALDAVSYKIGLPFWLVIVVLIVVIYFL
uniref:Flavin-containing amine oxidase n=1 Tax=Marseillevirus LCMAC102 TaxID=2506603 RepID=A0A481YSL8_9VIRU|nr:MAG: flavin-containing amine oxidase [Marseillevirus LCMAC102]